MSDSKKVKQNLKKEALENDFFHLYEFCIALDAQVHSIQHVRMAI